MAQLFFLSYKYRTFKFRQSTLAINRFIEFITYIEDFNYYPSLILKHLSYFIDTKVVLGEYNKHLGLGGALGFTLGVSDSQS